VSNRNSNYPNNKLNEVNGKEYVGKTVTSLIELSKWGVPKTEMELEERFDKYFDYCITNNLRPGIEQMCLALGTSRQSFNNWISGKCNKSYEWIRLCTWAKQVTVAFIENASLSGFINPATACFSLKNWAGYSDTRAVVETESEDVNKRMRFEDLPMFLELLQEGDDSYDM